jgi:hypothetical protein
MGGPSPYRNGHEARGEGRSALSLSEARATREPWGPLTSTVDGSQEDGLAGHAENRA